MEHFLSGIESEPAHAAINLFMTSSSENTAQAICVFHSFLHNPYTLVAISSKTLLQHQNPRSYLGVLR